MSLSEHELDPYDHEFDVYLDEIDFCAAEKPLDIVEVKNFEVIIIYVRPVEKNFSSMLT